MQRYRDNIIFYLLLILTFGLFTSTSIITLSSGFICIASLFELKRVKKFVLSSVSTKFTFMLFLWGLASVLTNLDNLLSVNKSLAYSRYYIAPIIIGYVVSHLTLKLNSEKIKTWCTIWIIGACFATLYGFARIKLGVDWFNTDIFSTDRNPGISGIMKFGYACGLALSILTPCLLNEKLRKKLPINNNFLVISYFIILFGLVSSGCRGAMLAYLCSIFFSLMSLESKKWAWSYFGLGVLATIILAWLLSSGNMGSSRYFQKLASPSNLIRISLFESAIKATYEKPWFGQGPKQMKYQSKRIKEKYDIDWRKYCHKYNWGCNYDHRERFFHNAHNVYLERFANLGFIGGILFLLWIIAWIYEIWKREDIYKWVFLSFIAAMCVSGLVHKIFDTHNTYLICLVYGLSFIKKEHISTHSTDKSS